MLEMVRCDFQDVLAEDVHGLCHQGHVLVAQNVQCLIGGSRPAGTFLPLTRVGSECFYLLADRFKRISSWTGY